MRRYSRYITENFASSALFITAGLTCVIWLTQSLRFVDMIVNRGLDILAFLYLTTMLLPSLLGFMLPIALGISVLYCYNRLIVDSELVVLKSIGLSRGQIAKPALLFALLMVVVGYMISLYLLPLSYRQYKDMQAFARDNYASLLLQEGVFNSPVDGLTVFIRERQSDGTLKGILVHDNRNPEKPVTMMAEEGRLVKTPQGPRFTLLKGNRQEIDHQEERLSFLAFDDYVLDISLYTSGKGVRMREAKERYMHELWSPEDQITSLQRAEFHMEAHGRLTWPLYNLALPLFSLAVLLGGQFNRRGNWRRHTVAVLGNLVIISLAVATNNFLIKHLQWVWLMYALPICVGGTCLFFIMHSPLKPPVPSGPTSADMATPATGGA